MFNQTKLSVQSINNSFNFNWNDYRTIEPNKIKITSIESVIKESWSSINTLEEKERKALGEVSYKLGTFYNHIKRTPVPALEALRVAEKILTDKELLWVKNHIAFSYQQKLVSEKTNENRIAAFEYCDQVIKHYDNLDNADIESIKIIAFAYCVKALVEYEIKELDEALKDYRLALDLYEKYGLLDDQYARAKNRYAQFLVEQKQYSDAEKAFEELEKYWSENQDTYNPYPARFFISYAGYLAEYHADNMALALEKYKKAHEILSVTDGEQAHFTKDIYKKISEIEEKLNNNTLEESSIYRPGFG